MKIVIGNKLQMNNLISYSGKLTTINFQKSVINIVNNFKEYMLNSGDECILTTTKSVELLDEEQVLDVEILLPVCYRIPIEEPYIFKEEFMITNALYTKVEDVMKLQDTMNEVNQYIVENKLQPITSAYLVQTKQENKPIVEIYIGLNPNIL